MILMELKILCLRNSGIYYVVRYWFDNIYKVKSNHFYKSTIDAEMNNY